MPRYDYKAQTSSSKKLREEEKIPFKSRIYIATEGVETERKYFLKLEENSKDFVNKTIDIIPIVREKKDGRSNPNHIRNGIKEYYNEKINNFIKGIDSLWIVIDTDQHFNSNTEYMEFISSLNIDVKIEAAISNPSFELWLMLHYETAEEIDKTSDLKKIKENIKESNKNTYIKKELTKKNKERFLKGNTLHYYEHTKTAIKNAKSQLLVNENEKIYNNVGTTVSKLMEIIINGED